MRLSIISDLHIRDAEDPLYHDFLRWLAAAGTGPEDRVVLAGDIFDLFVGNKPVFVRRYTAFFNLVRTLSARGVAIDYIEGNHDFWISDAFAGRTVHVHSDHVEFEMGGSRFHVAHGDLADREDRGYLALRGFFRSRVMQTLVRAVPGEWLDAIGQSMSRASSRAKPRSPEELQPARREKLRAAYHEYARKQIARGADFVVCGHCHELDEARLSVGGRQGQYINVGYPRVHASALAWTSGQSIERTRLPGD